MSLEQDGFDICELDWQIAADAKVGDTYAFKVHDDVDGASATPISHAYPARTDAHGRTASCLRNACPQGSVAARARFESGRHRSSLRPAPCRTAVPYDFITLPDFLPNEKTIIIHSLKYDRIIAHTSLPPLTRSRPPAPRRYFPALGSPAVHHAHRLEMPQVCARPIPNRSHSTVALVCPHDSAHCPNPSPDPPLTLP